MASRFITNQVFTCRFNNGFWLCTLSILSSFLYICHLFRGGVFLDTLIHFAVIIVHIPSNRGVIIFLNTQILDMANTQICHSCADTDCASTWSPWSLSPPGPRQQPAASVIVVVSPHGSVEPVVIICHTCAASRLAVVASPEARPAKMDPGLHSFARSAWPDWTAHRRAVHLPQHDTLQPIIERTHPQSETGVSAWN